MFYAFCQAFAEGHSLRFCSNSFTPVAVTIYGLPSARSIAEASGQAVIAGLLQIINARQSGALIVSMGAFAETSYWLRAYTAKRHSGPAVNGLRRRVLREPALRLISGRTTLQSGLQHVSSCTS
jgi:hypothetical protein